MMTKEEFAATLARAKVPVSVSELAEMGFDEAAPAAMAVQAAMPGIGFMSRQGRINCFMTVCRHLDQLIELGDINLAQSELILNIIRLKNKNFLKAITMFDFLGRRSNEYQRARMPRAAREYLDWNLRREGLFEWFKKRSEKGERFGEVILFAGSSKAASRTTTGCTSPQPTGASSST